MDHIFFFQAEDGIRAGRVTGVQTCALPISAQLFREDTGIWLQKCCPEHGMQRARVSGDAQAFLELGRLHRRASVPRSEERRVGKECSSRRSPSGSTKNFSSCGSTLVWRPAL